MTMNRLILLLLATLCLLARAADLSPAASSAEALLLMETGETGAREPVPDSSHSDRLEDNDKIVHSANNRELQASTRSPINSPTRKPSTSKPSRAPQTSKPSKTPTTSPTTSRPSKTPTTSRPTRFPSFSPTSSRPTKSPTTSRPTKSPSRSPTTSRPSRSPTTSRPTRRPTGNPTKTDSPTGAPTTMRPSRRPTQEPTTTSPTRSPTRAPTKAPTKNPTTGKPTSQPTRSPVTSFRLLPSVLLFLTDDMGYGDVGYLGSLAKTPRIDALANAKSSLRLDNFHSGSAVCSPSRASIISGRNPERDCMLGALEDYKGYTLRPDMPSMGRFLKNAGHRTAFFGKWHLGVPPPSLGFEHWRYSHASVATFDPGCFCPEKACVTRCNSPGEECYKRKGGLCSSKKTLQCETGAMGKAPQFGHTNFACNLRDGSLGGPPTRLVDFPRNVTASEHISSLAVDYLDTVYQNEAFFIQISYHEPHVPYIASEWAREDCLAGRTCRLPNIQRFALNSREVNFYAALGFVDKGMGSVIDKLQSMNRIQDTIIIFTSDNGAEAPKQGGMTKLPETRYLRDFKRTVYEGGTRVPMIFSWPQKVRSNYIVTEPTSMQDIFPTIAAIMQSIDPNMDNPESLDRVTGESFLPMITNPSKWSRTAPFGVCMPLTFVQKNVCNTFSYIEGDIKIVATLAKHGFAKTEAYDIVTDSLETIDLSKSAQMPAGILVRARAWRDELFADYSVRCKNRR